MYDAALDVKETHSQAEHMLKIKHSTLMESDFREAKTTESRTGLERHE